jgi:hypothetical protein
VREVSFGTHEGVKKPGILGFFVRYNPPFREPMPRYVGMEARSIEPLIGDAIENLLLYGRDEDVKVYIDPRLNNQAARITGEFRIYGEHAKVKVEFETSGN